MIGLSVATKWPGVVLVVVIVAAYFTNAGFSTKRLGEEFPKLILAGALALLSLFLASPFIFLDFATVLRDVAREAHSNHVSSNGHGFLGNLWWYLSEPVVLSISIAGLFIAFFGIADSSRKNSRQNAVLLAFPVTFILFISALSLRWERWIVPILPFLSLYAAADIFALGKIAGRMVHRRSLETAVATGVLLIITMAIALTSNLNARATERRNDTRAVAGTWLLKNVPIGSRLLMEAYTPQLPQVK